MSTQTFEKAQTASAVSTPGTDETTFFVDDAKLLLAHKDDGGNVTHYLGVQNPSSGDLIYWNGSAWTKLAIGSEDQVLTVASGAPAWETPSGGGGDQLERFTANQAIYPSSNAASGASRNGHAVVAYDDTTDESVIFEGVMSKDYSASDLTAKLHWVAATATSGNVRWNVAFERMAANGHDIDADDFAAVQAATGAANATSGKLTVTSIAFTQAQADSIAAGEAFRLKVTRDADNAADTMTGDAQLLRVQVEQ
jgi:hypothetical protein